MPRYFFNFSARNESVRDMVGVHLRDVREAHWYAVRLIARTLASMPAMPAGWVVRITDAQGSCVLDVLIGTAVRRREDRRPVTRPGSPRVDRFTRAL